MERANDGQPWPSEDEFQAYRSDWLTHNFNEGPGTAMECLMEWLRSRTHGPTLRVPEKRNGVVFGEFPIALHNDYLKGWDDCIDEIVRINKREDEK